VRGGLCGLRIRLAAGPARPLRGPARGRSLAARACSWRGAWGLARGPTRGVARPWVPRAWGPRARGAAPPAPCGSVRGGPRTRGATLRSLTRPDEETGHAGPAALRGGPGRTRPSLRGDQLRGGLRSGAVGPLRSGA